MNRFNMLKSGNTEGTGDTKIQILIVVFQVRFLIKPICFHLFS